MNNETNGFPDVNLEVSLELSDKPEYIGFIAMIVAILLYAVNYLPVKKFDTGDGMFFQWILCSAVWCTGMIINFFQNSPKFYPLAMLGGFSWATANLCVVPIIQTVGVGLGILIWGSFNLLSGWASGRFGWFGLTPEVPSHPVLNYLGVTFCIGRTLIFLAINNESSMSPATIPLINQDPDILISADNLEESSVFISVPPQVSWVSKLTPFQKRIIGCSLCIGAGFIFGLTFTPTIYIQNNYLGASQKGLDYVFAVFSGIYATSTFYFIVYCAFKQNKPIIYPRLILPAFISGLMWAIATACWFVANEYTSEAISFPIISAGPGVLAALLGVFLFKEIKGLKNYLLLALAFVITLAGAIMCALSL